MQNLLFALLLTGWVTAQTQPDFQFTLFARDAAGNVDSVVLGYTTQTAMWENGVDTTFWDSTFEMKANWDDVWSVVANDTIIYNTGGSCPNGILFDSGISLLYILCKNLPVTFFWDSDLFDPLLPANFCRKETYFQDYNQALSCDPVYHETFPPMPLANFGGFYETSFAHRDSFWTIPEKVLVQTGPTQTDSAYVLYFGFSSGWITGEEKVGQIDFATLAPNPARSTLLVSLAQAQPGTSMALHDLQGRSLLSATTSDAAATLNVEGLAPGVYVLHITQGSQTAACKVVKE